MHVPKGNKAPLPRHVAVSCAQAPTGAASLVATQCHGRAWLSSLFPSTAAPMLFGKTRADLGGLGGCPDLGVWQVSLAMEASRQLERSQRGLLSLCAASDAAGPQGPSVRTPDKRPPRPPRPLGRDGGGPCSPCCCLWVWHVAPKREYFLLPGAGALGSVVPYPFITSCPTPWGTSLLTRVLFLL